MEILENNGNTIIIGFILVRESNSRRVFNSTETSKLSPTLNVGLATKDIDIFMKNQIISL